MSLFGSIKSIQRGTVTANGATTGTATITSVNTAKTELRYLGFSSASAILDRINSRIDLTNATTVTLTKATASDAATASFEVTEFY
jgi:hypothetical protein